MVTILFLTTQPKECAGELPGDPLIRATIPFVRAPRDPVSAQKAREQQQAARGHKDIKQEKVLNLTRE